ncbi:unnamed protein product, partial [Brassica rapa subsp. narinosa]
LLGYLLLLVIRIGQDLTARGSKGKRDVLRKRSDIPCVATAGKRLRLVPSKNSRKSKKMKTTPGYNSRLGEELNLEDMSPMTILDGMESGTLASLAPVTKTIQAENVKVIGVDQIDQVSEASRSKKKNKPFSATNRTADRAAEGADQFDGAQSVGARNNQGEILETNRESPAKERQKKKRSVEKRQNKFSENGLREPVGMDKMIKSKSWSSLRRLRAPMTPLFIYIFVRYKK